MPSDVPVPREWVVEVNFAGCRFLRWAEKRRHLLGLNPRSFVAPPAPLPQPEIV